MRDAFDRLDSVCPEGNDGRSAPIPGPAGDADIALTGLVTVATGTVDRPHDFIQLSRTEDGKLQATIEAAQISAGQVMYFEDIALPSTQAARDLLIDDMFDL